MDGDSAKQLGLYLLFWIAYFLIVYAACFYVYRRLRGEPPQEGNRPVLVKGQTIPAKVFWEERDKRFRKIFLRVVMILMFVPLLLPLILRLVG